MVNYNSSGVPGGLRKRHLQSSTWLSSVMIYSQTILKTGQHPPPSRGLSLTVQLNVVFIKKGVANVMMFTCSFHAGAWTRFLVSVTEDFLIHQCCAGWWQPRSTIICNTCIQVSPGSYPNRWRRWRSGYFFKSQFIIEILWYRIASLIQSWELKSMWDGYFALYWLTVTVVMFHKRSIVYWSRCLNYARLFHDILSSTRDDRPPIAFHQQPGGERGS